MTRRVVSKSYDLESHVEWKAIAELSTEVLLHSSVHVEYVLASLGHHSLHVSLHLKGIRLDLSLSALQCQSIFLGHGILLFVLLDRQDLVDAIAVLVVNVGAIRRRCLPFRVVDALER